MQNIVQKLTLPAIIIGMITGIVSRVVYYSTGSRTMTLLALIVIPVAGMAAAAGISTGKDAE